MIRRLIYTFLLVALFPAVILFAQAPTTVGGSALLDPQAAPQLNSREDELYNQGTSALDEGDYEDAANKFDQLAKMRGRRADAALYWKAYALKNSGNKVEAQATINELRKAYPQSKWLKDAGALEVEMKGAAANPDNISDEDLKVLALQSLMNSEPERAVPMLDKVIHGNYPPKLKDKALFVLSQSSSDQAQQILFSLAKANNDPDLQKRAIRYMGMGGNRNRAVLKEIYNGTTDVSVKKSVFQGWLMTGDKEDVLAVARTEKSAELRKDAIRYLGMMGGRTELREMYKSSTDPETREAVVQGMLMSGDSQGLGEIATTDKDANVREKAIKTLGMTGGRSELRSIYKNSADPATREAVVGAMLLCGDSQGLAEIAAVEKDPNVLDKAINTLGMVGGQESLTALTNIYNLHNDLATKKRVINALFLHGAAKEMVALARKETNPELKKAWIQKLSLMQSPEVTEYMMEILNK